LPIAAKQWLRLGCMTPASLATGVTFDALATPQPHSLIGRVACTHGFVETGAPTTALHVARCFTVTPCTKADVWRSGSVRRAFCTFAGPRQVCANFKPLLPG